MWISYLIFRGFLQRCRLDGLLSELTFVVPNVVCSELVMYISLYFTMDRLFLSCFFFFFVSIIWLYLYL